MKEMHKMKIDLILENVRNKYNLDLLEESEGLNEKDLLSGKMLINESTMIIRKMLVEGEVIENTQALLQEDWTDAIQQGISHFTDDAGDAAEAVGDVANRTAGALQYGAHQGAALGGYTVGAGNPEYEDIIKTTPSAIGNAMRNGYENGYDPNADISNTYNAGKFIGKHPVVSAAIPGAIIGGAGAFGAIGAGKAINAAKRADTSAIRKGASQAGQAIRKGASQAGQAVRDGASQAGKVLRRTK